MTNNKKTEKILSGLLTFGQYSTLIFLLYYLKWFSPNVFLLSIQTIGFFVALWAIIEMSKSRLNITPTPRHGAVLIKTGPYKIIRHPMYLSLILTLTPALISDFSLVALIVFVIFLTNLIVKMLFEESLLIKFFGSEYQEYMKKSWRLFPFIF